MKLSNILKHGIMASRNNGYASGKKTIVNALLWCRIASYFSTPVTYDARISCMCASDFLDCRSVMTKLLKLGLHLLEPRSMAIH
jgi:hypothetical protein